MAHAGRILRPAGRGGAGILCRRLRQTFGMLRAVLFDWDGTLLDSAEATFRCYQQILSRQGIAFDREDFARTYSPDWYRTYEAIGLAQENWSEADALWLELYSMERSRPHDGVSEALDRLQSAGLVTALVTSGSRRRVQAELAAHRLDHCFAAAVFFEDVSRRKPHPEAVSIALERLRVTPAAAAFVGDSPEDIVMARAAGVFSVAVPGPFPNRRALEAAQPDLLAPDLSAAAEALIQRASGLS